MILSHRSPTRKVKKYRCPRCKRLITGLMEWDSHLMGCKGVKIIRKKTEDHAKGIKN